jgi:hypothetical protein
MTLAEAGVEQAVWDQDSGCMVFITELNTWRFAGSIDCSDTAPTRGDPHRRLRADFEAGRL